MRTHSCCDLGGMHSEGNLTDSCEEHSLQAGERTHFLRLMTSKTTTPSSTENSVKSLPVKTPFPAWNCTTATVRICKLHGRHKTTQNSCKTSRMSLLAGSRARMELWLVNTWPPEHKAPGSCGSEPSEVAGAHRVANLPHDNPTGTNWLASVHLDTAVLGVRIAAVLCRAGTLLVRVLDNELPVGRRHSRPNSRTNYWRKSRWGNWLGYGSKHGSGDWLLLTTTMCAISPTSSVACRC